MSIEEVEKISAAICDSHKCGASCQNRRATIDNWDDAANCFNSFRYPGYEKFLNDHPAILKAALKRLKDAKKD